MWLKNERFLFVDNLLMPLLEFPEHQIKKQALPSR
jgi:hypothetical protein